MKNAQKSTITLSMLWIGLMMVLSRPGWVRNALDFVKGSTSSTVANSGGAATGNANRTAK